MVEHGGSGGWKSPIGVQGQGRGGDLGAKPPETISSVHNRVDRQ